MGRPRYGVSMNYVLQGGRLVTHSAPGGRYVGFDADIVVENGHIASVVPPGCSGPDLRSIDVSGLWLVPGFAQAHTHLIQTLFRGMADDLSLLDWLRHRIWPLEAAHDAESAYWSARLGLTELLLGGTTAILDMASVHHTEAVFRAAEECGIRAHIGKAMMDQPNEAGLSESTEESIRSSCILRDRWHGRGRLRYAFAPRFVPSCTETLLSACLQEARRTECLIHTHASENTDEVELVRSLTGRENIEYLHDIGMTGSDVVLAHCIHLSPAELRILAETQTAVVHCPGSNLKLASGIAQTPAMIRNGSRLAIGADGAPCNNRLDMFAEMRLAALIQKPSKGADALAAADVLDVATVHGSRILRTGGGDLRVGAAADIIALDPNLPHSFGGGPPAGSLVYAMTPANVVHVWVGGEPVVRDGAITAWEWSDTLAGCTAALTRIKAKTGF